MRTDDEVKTVAQEYIDGALRIQGSGAPPAEESYQRAIAGAETAFRRLSAARRRTPATPAGNAPHGSV
jgi:hypothetical protein